MLGIALTIMLSKQAVDTEGFHVMRDIGLTPPVVATLFWTIGLLRIAALYANGHWPVYGPWCRFFCSIGGGFIWAQMSLSLVYWSWQTGRFTIEVSFCLMLTVGEMISAYRATNDGRSIS